ncbi:AMP-binding enzyme, partial [Ramlibacter sp.]|uniref:AMP-binding enzyme n=1 Tax=Ramlibacter sp. TaxID=1917967 RepID=UPI003D123A9E
KVYPPEVENLLLQHEAVEDVAVAGVPHEELGQLVTAVVQARHAAHAGPSLADELIDWCRSRLSRVKCPRTVVFVDALPRSDAGKLLRRRVREHVTKGD